MGSGCPWSPRPIFQWAALGDAGAALTFKDAPGSQRWEVQWGAILGMRFSPGFDALRRSSFSLMLPTLEPDGLPWVARGSHHAVARCGWEEMCGPLSPRSLPIQAPWHKLLSIVMGPKIFFLCRRVELRSRQWVAKLNSCLCFKLEWKSLGQCPKSSYFCHLRLRGLFLGTKPPLVNIEQGSGWLQWWTNRFAFPFIRKQRQQQKPETSSLNLRVWNKSLHSLKD